MPQRRDVPAAGVVVLRPGREVLLVHRPRYDDWSLPKGKLDPGEPAAVAAVREVGEETGLRVRLGPPLGEQRYPVNGGSKTVRWWVGWPTDGDDVSGYRVNGEIDEVGWLPYADARRRLSYDRDRDTLAEATRLRKRTRALVVLRHAEAEPRGDWTGRTDRERPLVARGHEQARLLVPLLAAYGATRVVTSSSTRCVQTVRPYADASGWKPERLDGLSEEDATVESVVSTVDELLHGPECVVLCTHRKVLPSVFDALGLPDPRLEKGALLVAHHRKGRVVATEAHERP